MTYKFTVEAGGMPLPDPRGPKEWFRGLLRDLIRDYEKKLEGATALREKAKGEEQISLADLVIKSLKDNLILLRAMKETVQVEEIP
jgi:hypothetical protein